MQKITKTIQKEAQKLLNHKKVDVVIGYCRSWDGEETVPCFITRESEAEQLIFNHCCFHNLAKYLVGKEGYLSSYLKARKEPSKVAIVATPKTLRTIVGLIQENQFERKQLIVLGIVDGSAGGIKPDIEVGRIGKSTREEQKLWDKVREIENLSLSKRLGYWKREVSKCIRCYACRQVCPFCYCEQCIVEENQPQWIDRSFSVENNMIWHIIRALHLVGRCTNCGECERVCPMEIPLNKLNAKMIVEIKEAFDYVAGIDMETTPPLFEFRVDDKEEFIK